jgi:DNA-binding XRE family transcriptional regulator
MYVIFHIMKQYSEIKKQLFKNTETKKAYDSLDPEYQAISKIIEFRIKNKLTQKELAQKIGTKQSSIARFENQIGNPTVNFLSKLANVFDKKLIIDFK